MFQQIVPFLTAAVIGLLIGFERERSKNHDGEKSILGVRTLPLIALLGGLMAFLDHQALLIIVSVFVVIIILGGGARWNHERRSLHFGATTAVASLLTYILGYLAQTDGRIAIIIAVLLFGFLSLKGRLDSFARTGITQPEMSAVLIFLVSAFVILPLLPNHFVDPWELVHPTRIWMLFVIITSVEFCSYIALRQLGEKWGTLLSGLLGGVVSATATTLTLAKRMKEQPDTLLLVSGGIILAEVSSLLIQIIVLGVVAPTVFTHLVLYLAIPTVIGILSVAGLIFFRRKDTLQQPVEIALSNPISFKSAFSFTLLISIGLILIALGARWLGPVGVYATSALGGMASLRVVTFSVSELTSSGEIQVAVAALGILIAMTTNMLVKLAIIFRAGRTKLLLVCALFFTLMLAGGFSALLLNHF